MNVPQRQKLTLKQEIRLSPATLDLVSLAHRTLAVQTSQLEGAAADLFRRCERLREELSNQVKRMGELASRMQHLDNENEDDEHISRNFNSRMKNAEERQRGLSERYEVLRRNLARAGMAGKDLSAKETAWAAEITDLARMVGIEAEEADDGDGDEQIIRGNLLDERYASVSNSRATLFHVGNIHSPQTGQAISERALSPSGGLAKSTAGFRYSAPYEWPWKICVTCITTLHNCEWGHACAI